MKEDDGPLLMESESLVCQMERGGGLFFLLDSQVIRIFRLKNRLIILSAVTYVIRGKMYFRVARDQPGNYWMTIFLEMVAD